jgi:hypothetical protein
MPAPLPAPAQPNKGRQLRRPPINCHRSRSFPLSRSQARPRLGLPQPPPTEAPVSVDLGFQRPPSLHPNTIPVSPNLGPQPPPSLHLKPTPMPLHLPLPAPLTWAARMTESVQKSPRTPLSSLRQAPTPPPLVPSNNRPRYDWHRRPLSSEGSKSSRDRHIPPSKIGSGPPRPSSGHRKYWPILSSRPYRTMSLCHDDKVYLVPVTRFSKKPLSGIRSITKLGKEAFIRGLLW